MKNSKSFLKSMEEWAKDGMPVAEEMKYMDDYVEKFGNLKANTWDMGFDEIVEKLKKCLGLNKPWEEIYGIDDFDYDDVDL